MGKILSKLLEEGKFGLRGGLLNKTQIKFAYHTNRIEGSKLTEEQTRYIFETKTIGFDTDGLPVDDIIEANNHFRAFDYLLDTIDAPLSNEIIKEYHRILKSGISDAFRDYFNVGGWKKIPNEVANMETTKPEDVEVEMTELLENYLSKSIVTFEDIITFHYKFEAIHLFQDGNGRVGRLIMFRECLKHDIMPFIISDEMKLYYYRGLKEFTNDSVYLIDTCGAAQDTYEAWVKYFYPEVKNSN